MVQDVIIAALAVAIFLLPAWLAIVIMESFERAQKHLADRRFLRDEKEEVLFPIRDTSEEDEARRVWEEEDDEKIEGIQEIFKWTQEK